MDVTHFVYYQCTNRAMISACNKHFITWFARAYGTFSLSQKKSLTRSLHSLVRDIFFGRENVPYALVTHVIIYTYYRRTGFYSRKAMKIFFIFSSLRNRISQSDGVRKLSTNHSAPRPAAVKIPGNIFTTAEAK